VNFTTSEYTQRIDLTARYEELRTVALNGCLETNCSFWGLNLFRSEGMAAWALIYLKRQFNLPIEKTQLTGTDERMRPQRHPPKLISIMTDMILNQISRGLS